MPRHRRRKRRRTFRRKRGMSTRKAAFMALSRVDMEKKTLDFSTNGTPLVVSITTPRVIPLNVCSEGTDPDDRIGRQAKFLSVTIRLTVSDNATRAGFRLMLVLDKQPNGVLATAANLLSDSVNDPENSLLNLNNNKRFKLLHSWWTLLDNNVKLQQHHKHFRKLGFSTRYNGAATGIGTLTTNALLLFMVSNVATINTLPVDYHIRVRFVG